jgi:hypothetical protein
MEGPAPAIDLLSHYCAHAVNGRSATEPPLAPPFLCEHALPFMALPSILNNFYLKNPNRAPSSRYQEPTPYTIEAMGHNRIIRVWQLASRTCIRS